MRKQRITNRRKLLVESLESRCLLANLVLLKVPDVDRPCEMVGMSGLFRNTAMRVSADGTTVAGHYLSYPNGCYSEKYVGYYWTASSGMTPIPLPEYYDFGGFNNVFVSRDGKIIQGPIIARDEYLTFTSPYGVVLSNHYDSQRVLISVSDDASTRLWIKSWGPTPRYSIERNGQTRSLDFNLNTAPLMNSDGSVLAVQFGWPHLWTEKDGLVPLGKFPFSRSATVQLLSGDGTVAYGKASTFADSSPKLVRWHNGNAEIIDGLTNFTLTDTTADGEVLIGTYIDANFQNVPFVWTRATGVIRLVDYLHAYMGVATGNIQIQEAVDISADGKVMVGSYRHPGNAQYYSWVASTDHPVPSSLPDIVATGLDIRSDNVQLAWSVQKQAIDADPKLSLYWSNDATFDPRDDQLAYAYVPDSSKVIGDYSTTVRKDQLAADLRPYLILVVDSDNLILESDEADGASSSNNLKVALVRPDIKATELVREGETLSFGWTIRGAAVPMSFDVSLYWSDDDALDNGDGIAYVGNVSHFANGDYEYDLPKSSLSAGRRTYLLFVVDSYREIWEYDEDGTGDIGINNVVALQFLTNFTWLVHGFNPRPDQGYEKFRANYQPGGTYNQRTLEALESTGKMAQVDPINWVSSDGWVMALGALLIKMLPKPIRIEGIMNALLDHYIESGLRTARLRSLEASEELRSAIVRRLAHAGPNSTVTLIGHSRGGEVAARAARLVRNQLDSLGIKSQIVLLDGYGTDWPGISGLLGVDNPFLTFRGGDLNIRAATGLGGLAQITRDFLSLYIGYNVPESVLPDDTQFMGAAEWRAPERAAMTNFVLPGSAHTTISGQFFELPIENWLSALVGQRGRSSGEGAGFNDVAMVSDVVGGDSERLVQNYLHFLSAISQQRDSTPVVNGFIEGLKDPRAWLNMHWQSHGVELSASTKRFVVQESATMSQAISVPPGGTMIKLDLGDVVQSSGASADITVSFNGIEQRTTILGAKGFDSLLFYAPNMSAMQKVGTLKIQFTSTDPHAELTFARVSSAIDQPNLSIAVAVTNGLPALVVQQEATVSLEDYTFYRESNGVPGLQIGEGGDGELERQGDRLLLRGSEPVPTTVLVSFVPNGSNLPQYFEILVVNRYRTNFQRPLDTNASGQVTPLDALLIINYLNTTTPGIWRFPDNLYDVTADGDVTAIDALYVIDYLNNQIGSGEATPSSVTDVETDDCFATDDLTEYIEKLRRKVFANFIYEEEPGKT